MFTKLFQQFFQRSCAKSQGILLVITGPSGVGKDTTKELFIKRNPDFHKIITDTNRQPRAGEENGVNYNFYSDEDFKKRISEGKYLEYIEVRPGEYKGTSKEAISAILTGKMLFGRWTNTPWRTLKALFGKICPILPNRSSIKP